MVNKDIIIYSFGLVIAIVIIMMTIVADRNKIKEQQIKTIIKNIFINIIDKFKGRIRANINNLTSNICENTQHNTSEIKNDESTLKVINSFMSLAPTDEAKNYDFYDLLITKVLTEKNNVDQKIKNKNIAITGIYSGGKSSIMKTYLSRHPERRALILSLGKYSDKNNDFSEEEIEYNLLQQIIYHVEPQKLPFSEISRIDSNYKNVKKNATLFSIVSVVVLVLFLCLTNYNSIHAYIKIINSSTEGLLLSFVLIIMAYITYVLRIAYIKVYSKLRNFKIKIKGKVEVEPESTSVFRKSIGEFVHFFKQTDFDTVVFEDIDRLDDPIKMFTKIKELNMILNNAIKSRQIQFVYELGDSVFETSEHRTKFFDAIIPIVSYTNIQESSISLQHLFNENFTHNLSISDFEFIGAFVNNTRILNEIYNEFIVYYSCNSTYIGSGRNFTNLFYLISYKVLFPQKFNQLLQGEGIVAYYLKDDFRNKVVTYYKDKRKKELDEEITKLKRENASKLDLIIEEFITNIQLLPNPNGYDLVFCDNEEPILRLDVLKDNPNLIDKLNVDNLKLIGLDEEGEEQVFIEEERIFKSETKTLFFEKISDLKNDRNTEEMNREVANLSATIKYNNLTKKDIIEYLKQIYNKLTTEEKNEMLNSFEERLIERDYIDPYYQTLLTIQKESDKEIVSTKLIIQDLLRGNNREYDLKLKHAEYYVNTHKDEFSRDSFCMKDFYRVIVDDQRKDIIELIFNNLSIYKLNNIMLMELDGINILSLAKEYFGKIWKVLEYSDSLNSEQIALYSFYIIKTIIYANPEEMNANINFKNCVENIKSIDNTISDNYELIKDKIKLYDFDFKQKEFTLSCTNFYNYIYDDCELNENLELFYSLLANKGIMISDSKIFTSYKNIEKTYPKIYNYAMNHIKELVLTSEKELSDSEEVLISVINSGWLSDLELFSQVIKKENIKFKDISKIDVNYYKILMDCEKIEANLNNMAFLYEHREEIEECDEFLLKIANSEYSSLINTPYKENLDDVVKSIIYNDNLNLEAFKKLSDYYFRDESYTSNIREISKDKIEYLIEKGYLAADTIDSLIQIDNNINITDPIKEKFIENSFELIKDNVYDEMNESILEKIAKLDYDAQERLNYILKYKDKFDERVYSIIADNISFEECEIEEEDLIRIIREKIPTTQVIETKKKKQVIRSIEKNIDKISNDTIKNELSRLDDKFASIFEDNGKAKRLSKDFYSKEMLFKIMQRGIIKSFEPYKTNCFIINKKANARTKQP